MSKIAEEKVFKLFLDLPEKARMEVFNEMQPDDRCRLTRCSKQCSKEAKSSNKFLYSLSFGESYKKQIYIYVNYDKNHDKGYKLEMEDTLDKKNMTYHSLDFKTRREFWRMELDNSTDMVEFGVQIFKGLLVSGQKSIEHLEIVGEKFRGMSLDFDFGIEKFDKLHSLFLRDIDVSKIFSKLTRPLSFLNFMDRKNHSALAKFEQMYQVHYLLAEDVQLNFEQFQRLNSPKASLHIGQITEMDIFHLIKAWQRGELRDDFEYYSWGLFGSNFDVQKLFKLFGMEIVDDGKTRFTLDFVHDKDPSKIGMLKKSGKDEWQSLCFTRKLPFVFYP